mmetsp:Transcript_29248/g.43218  ORF Transcript_29248/g.43218 Transcript_29248/m.43218 type:complete len:95 (-) Transcript_29248:46-330(-)
MVVGVDRHPIQNQNPPEEPGDQTFQLGLVTFFASFGRQELMIPSDGVLNQAFKTLPGFTELLHDCTHSVILLLEPQPFLMVAIEVPNNMNRGEW